MKNIILVGFVASVLLSCKHKPHHHGNEFTTATGKTIVVSEAHSHSESLTTLEIQTSGFENDDTFALTDIDPVSFYELTDLDNNGFDELYIVTKSAGSGSYLSVIGYASNKDKSFTSIYFPELTDKDFDKGGLFEGYMGHDTFLFQKDKLVRQFPIYTNDDSNSRPTGGTQEIIYKLVKGEASWQLEVQ